MTKYLNNKYDLNDEGVIDLIDEMPLWSAPFGLKLLDNINLKKNINALDIGFGNGFPLTELAMRLGNSSKVYGIDPWEAAINRTKRKLDYYEICNVEIIKGVAENIPLKNDSIDLIVSNNGINNISDMPKVIEECSRVIKTGGQFVQTLNINTSLIEFYEIFKETLTEHNFENLIKKVDEHIYSKRKPLDEITNLLDNNGFQVNKLEHEKFEYRFVDGTAFLNHYFMRLAFMDSWKSIVPENMLTKIFGALESKINMNVGKESYFTLTIPFVLIDCEKK